MNHHVVSVIAITLIGLALLGTDIRCTQAEADRLSLAGLQAELDELRAAQDEEPVVIDSTGEVVGKVIGPVPDTRPARKEPLAMVQLDLDGAPLFTVVVDPQGIGSSVQHDISVHFELEDCEGTPWLSGGDPPGDIWGHARTSRPPFEVGLFYVYDPSLPEEIVFVRSRLQSGVCQNSPSTEPFFPAVAVDVHALFTPPFEIVKLGDM